MSLRIPEMNVTFEKTRNIGALAPINVVKLLCVYELHRP